MVKTMNLIHKSEHAVFPLRERYDFFRVCPDDDIPVPMNDLGILAHVAPHTENFKSARFVQPNSVTAMWDQEI